MLCSTGNQTRRAIKLDRQSESAVLESYSVMIMAMVADDMASLPASSKLISSLSSNKPEGDTDSIEEAHLPTSIRYDCCISCLMMPFGRLLVGSEGTHEGIIDLPPASSAEGRG